MVRDSVNHDSMRYMDYYDVREDRVNLFGTIGPSVQTIVYKIKAINPGQYVVPPAYAESMYNKNIQARGVASVITISQEDKN